MEVAVTLITVVFIYNFWFYWSKFRRYIRTRPYQIEFLKKGLSTMCQPLGKVCLLLVAVAVIWPIAAAISAVFFPIAIIGTAIYLYCHCKKEKKAND